MSTYLNTAAETCLTLEKIAPYLLKLYSSSESYLNEGIGTCDKDLLDSLKKFLAYLEENF